MEGLLEYFDHTGWRLGVDCKLGRLLEMALSAGTELGPYQIVAPLGAGGMGEVYRARDARLGRDVALKILPPELANDVSRRKRFEVEARAVAALNHPNIVAIYDVGEGYIVNELVDGEPLRGKVGWRRTIEIGKQIASGLAAAHDAGIVHRDLKPDNILLARGGLPKILDFGIAKIPAKTAAGDETVTVHTEPGVVMGSPGYMSPEQVRGLATDHRTDIFSFGVILHELLSGKRAFHGETSADTLLAILRQEPAELPETVPASVRAIVSHCLEKEAGRRFQSAHDLGFALTQAGSVSAISAVPRSLRAWFWGTVAAMAVVTALVAAAYLLMRRDASPGWAGVLLGGPERSSGPRPSPDGHWLAFIPSDTGDITQVAVMKPESGNFVILTHASDKGSVNNLSWSADGARIYYDRLADEPRGVYSVPVLGGEEQLVVEDAYDPEALPDGSLLVAKLNAARQNQLFRYWPETSLWKAFPLEMASESFGAARSFPDGREAVVIGTPIGPGHEAGVHPYAVDLESGKLRLLETGPSGYSKTSAVAASRDGKYALLAVGSGNVEQIVSIPRSGRRAPQVLFSVTNRVYALDAGLYDSIYLDQVERPVELLRFSSQGGPAEKIATLPSYEAPGEHWPADESFAVLRDGRAVVTQATGGRTHLEVVEAGKDPVPLVATAEENSSPVTAAGPNEIAFLIGPHPKRTIAMAAVSNGRITRRIPFDKGLITSLAASQDGKTLYCSAGGTIWSIPVVAGEPRKVRAGDFVAMDPAGRYLVVELSGKPDTRLIQVPLDGGAERELPRAGTQRPAFMIGPNAIGKDGRILTPLDTSTWYWQAGLINPRTGEITRIPVNYRTDFHGLAWTQDGGVIGLGLDYHTKMWKFQMEGK
jgi:hypothetical protein